MGGSDVAFQRAARRCLSRFVAVFRTPVWLEHRYLSRAKARHSTVTFASSGSDSADENAADQSNYRRAIPRPENRRTRSFCNGRESSGLRAISRRSPQHRHLYQVDRRTSFAVGLGVEIACVKSCSGQSWPVSFCRDCLSSSSCMWCSAVSFSSILRWLKWLPWAFAWRFYFTSISKAGRRLQLS